MEKIINGIFSVLKYLLMVVSFVLTFYVVMFMFKRLEKDYIGTLEVFIPYILLLVTFTINLLFDQKKVTQNLFYNLTCCLVFGVLIFAGYRAIFDEYLLSGIKMGYNINFNYYADMLAPLRSMLYLLIGSNIMLMLSGMKDKKKVAIKEPVEKKD